MTTHVAFTYTWQVPTHDELEVELEVEAKVSTFVPAHYGSLTYAGNAAEGGEIEHLIAYTPSGREADLDTPTFVGYRNTGEIRMCPLGDLLEERAIEYAHETQYD